MPRQLLSVLPILALGILIAACGGDGDEVERVSIRRIDFTGVELSAADFFAPPFADQYPAVVATVNGEPITGEALAARQVMLELGRRQAGDIGFDLLREQFLADVESTDPLEALIDEELERQAVERLGLLPPYDEAVIYTREQEEQFLHPQGTVSPENRQQTLEVLRLQGWPAEDWASNEQVVEGYRLGMGIGALRSGFCTSSAMPDAPGVVTTRRDCSEFLETEREKADIVYFVRWAG